MTLKIEKTLTVQNEMGLHARPAAQIVKLLRDFESQVQFTYKAKSVDAKQMMNLLLLEAHQSSEIAVTVEGIDADQVLSKLAVLFDTQFGEIIKKDD